MDDRNGRKEKLNLKHYFGRAGRHGATWAAALLVTTFGVGQVTTEMLRSDLDRDGSTPQAVEQFEQRMADLKAQKAELDYMQNLLSLDMLPAGADPAQAQREYRNNVYGFLSDVLINDESSSLSELDKATLLNRFHMEVEDVRNFGFHPVNRGAATNLNEFRAPEGKYDTEDFVSRINKAQDINNNALAKEGANALWGFLAMMTWAMLLFPGRREWKNGKTVSRWANEPPRKPKPPKYKH